MGQHNFIKKKNWAVSKFVGWHLTTSEKILHLYNANTVCFTNMITISILLLDNIKPLNKRLTRLTLFVFIICLFYFAVSLLTVIALNNNYKCVCFVTLLFLVVFLYFCFSLVFADKNLTFSSIRFVWLASLF